MATKDKKHQRETYALWGIALAILALTKFGSEAETLYNKAIEKFNKAIKYEVNPYKLDSFYSIKNMKAEIQKCLELNLSRNETTEDFVEQDKDWEKIRGNLDFRRLLSLHKKW